MWLHPIANHALRYGHLRHEPPDESTLLAFVKCLVDVLNDRFVHRSTELCFRNGSGLTSARCAVCTPLQPQICWRIRRRSSVRTGRCNVMSSDPPHARNKSPPFASQTRAKSPVGQF